MLEVILGTLGALAALVAASYLIESLRQQPATPASLPWAPELPIRWATVDGVRLRYIEAGRAGPWCCSTRCGPSSTSSSESSPRWRAAITSMPLDLPGHGYSDIPDGRLHRRLLHR